MEEAKEGVDVGLKYLYAVGESRCAEAEVFVEEEGAGGAKEGEGGNGDFDEVVEGASGESIEDLAGHAFECKSIEGHIAIAEVIADLREEAVNVGVSSG
jgi:hypothetical protein